MKVRIRYFHSYNSFKRVFGENILAENLLYPTFGLTVSSHQDYFPLAKLKAFVDKKIFSSLSIETGKNFVVLFGDLNSLQIFCNELKEFEEALSQKIEFLLNNYRKSENFEYQIGCRVFNSKNKYVMGILNVTSDSFFDGGKYLNKTKIKERIDEFINAGIDIIDIGGESTRPGSEPIPADEELSRILPAVDYALSKNAIVSIDTYKSKVAEKCLELGAHIINDISGFKFDKEMASICQRFKSSVVLMHIRGTPKTMQENPHYNDTVAEIFDELSESTKLAVEKGIKNIFVDPGIGFGKRLFDNLEILNRLEELKFLGYPILVGLSRKSFIGKLLNLTPDERLTGTIVSNSIALLKGANIIRVHDHMEAIQTKKLVTAITNPEITL